jgi:hypothetical protein
MDPELLDRALLELATGEPELVLVDKRVLRVLLGPLVDLIVMTPTNYGTAGFRGRAPLLPPGEEPYVWDEPDC